MLNDESVRRKIFWGVWVIIIAILSGNVERQAFLFQSNQNYLEYWLFYTLVILMWLLLIPMLTRRNIDYLAVVGLAFLFQLVEDWSYWIFSGYLLPQWFPALGNLSLINLPIINFPYFYYLDVLIGLPLVLLWVYNRY